MTEDAQASRLDDRILILAPVGKDAPLTLDVLRRAGLKGCVCATAAELCGDFAKGAAVIILTEEALEDQGIGVLMDCLRAQPAWSDVPILLFADAERSEIYLRTLRLLEGLRNVILLERPIRLGAALSLIRSAIRGRQRQYELRDLLKALADAREQAESANRLKDEFLATLSHELRTPLNAILGWTTMLRDRQVHPRHVMRAVETIHRNATAQVQIVNDLLDISRIVRGGVQLSPTLIPIGPVVALAVESIAPTAEAKGVRVTAAPAPEGVLVWADADRLQQVLWNLLANAVKFTPRGGRIDIAMKTDPADVCISVADTGHGISADFLPHVFERFRQADGSSTRTHGGLGLGLAIVRHLVELHGGRLTAESPGVGKGSTFSVYLPARYAEQRVSGPSTASRRRRPSLNLIGTHVLIVDDEEDARELLRAMIAGTGARITEASSVDEALRVVADDKPDIVVADLAMPGQDGYALMRAIRELPDGRGLQMRALAVSAYARQQDRQRALRAGFNDHLAKPIDPTRLVDALGRVRAGSRTGAAADAEPDAKVH
jgi:signal transduction histidine kinase/ActR/RegA family two-component response regulator